MLGAAEVNSARVQQLHSARNRSWIGVHCLAGIENIRAIVQNQPFARDRSRGSVHGVGKSRAERCQPADGPIAQQQSGFRLRECRGRIPVRENHQVVPLIEIRIAAVRVGVELF